MTLIKTQIQFDVKNLGRDASELSTLYKDVLKMSGMSLITWDENCMRHRENSEKILLPFKLDWSWWGNF